MHTYTYMETHLNIQENPRAHTHTHLCVHVRGCASQLKACEKIPTKKQLLATIAMLAKQPATKVATGIKQVPTKLAVAIKQVSCEVIIKQFLV